MSFNDLRVCMEELDVFVDDDFGEAPGCRVFRRHLMGLGSPYYTVASNGDNEPVYPPTIEWILGVFGIDQGAFIEVVEQIKSAR